MAFAISTSHKSALARAFERRFGASVMPYEFTYSRGDVAIGLDPVLTILDTESGSFIRGHFRSGRLTVTERHDAALATALAVKAEERAAHDKACEAETFELLDRPGTVFRTISHYMAAEVIPSVRGALWDGRETCARVQDVRFLTGPNVEPAAPVLDVETVPEAPALILIEVEDCGATVRAMLNGRCIVTAQHRRQYATGPRWILTYSDGSPAGSTDLVYCGLTLRKAARARLAAPVQSAPEALDVEPAEDVRTALDNGSDFWTLARFPLFIGRNGRWNIHASADGYCAALPTVFGLAHGHKASHFGDAGYVRATLGFDVLAIIAALRAPEAAPVAMVAQPVQQAQSRDMRAAPAPVEPVDGLGAMLARIEAVTGPRAVLATPRAAPEAAPDVVQFAGPGHALGIAACGGLISAAAAYLIAAGLLA